MCAFLFYASVINVANTVNYGERYFTPMQTGVYIMAVNKTESDSDLSQHIHTLYLVYRTIRLIGLINV